MLILHLRTLAFICSLSTTMQSILWITGYVFYIISYSCGYSPPQVSANASISFADYFIWYFEGSDCSSAMDSIINTRGQNPNTLAGLFSAGLGLNTSLLALSITVLIVLHSDHNVRPYSSRIRVYTVSIYLVSFWDALLVGFVLADIAPILKSSDLPLVTGVACITLMILSRFIVIWIVNIMFATFLLFKNESDVGAKQTPPAPPPNGDIHQPWNNGTSQNLATISKGEKEYFPRNNVLSRQIVLPRPADPVDEVPLRWTEYTGNSKVNDGFNDDNEVDDSFSDDSEVNDRFNEDSEAVQNRRGGSIIDRENKKIDIVNWSDAETHIRNSLHKWKNSRIQGLEDDSFRMGEVQDVQRPTEETKRSSILKNVRNSFRTTKSTDIVSPSPIEYRPQTIPPKTIEGFKYTANANPFNVKLRHVNRPSMSKESGKKESENSDRSEGDELFYKVTTVTDRNDLYVPRVPPVPKQPAPLYFSASQDSKLSSKAEAFYSPPTPPPIQDPLNDKVRKQMSLEEAIRTRGPLRSVKRPTIDTNC